MIITITHEDKNDCHWQDCSVRIPDGSDVFEVTRAIADCMKGVGFAPLSVQDGFDCYLEEMEYGKDEEDDDDDDEEDDDDTKTN